VHALLFCNERCPKGVDPQTADRELGREADQNGIDRDMGAKHAKVRPLGRDDGLVAQRPEPRNEDAGHRRSVKETTFALTSQHNKAGLAFPPTRRRRTWTNAQAARDRPQQGRLGAGGHIQGEARAREKLEHGVHVTPTDPYGPGLVPEAVPNGGHSV